VTATGRNRPLIRRILVWHMRPGSKIRFWSPKFQNKPSVEPPGLLRLLSGLSIVSVVGVLIYAVVLTLDGVSSTTRGTESAAYVAVLHFLLPLCVAYTISTNSAISRILITIYFVTLCAAVIFQKGFLGNLDFEPTVKLPVATAVFALLMAWLYRSPRMRVYYTLLLGKPIPPALESRAYDLAARSSLGPRTKAALEWLADRLETAVMLGFIVVVIYAWFTHGRYR